jgi:two-component system response regulator AdeR
MNKQDYKIAIIEDDIAIVQMYRTKFEHSGYVVETAGDGIAGLKLIADFKPDIILLDIMMPNMNGLEMMSSLRRQPEGRNAKVIILTNMGDAETATKVYKMAASDYIVKAELTPTEVEARVQKLLTSTEDTNTPA